MQKVQIYIYAKLKRGSSIKFQIPMKKRKIEFDLRYNEKCYNIIGFGRSIQYVLNTSRKTSYHITSQLAEFRIKNSNKEAG